MVYIYLKGHENINLAIKKFAKKVKNSGLFEEVNKRKWFRNKRDMRKFKSELPGRRKRRQQ